MTTGRGLAWCGFWLGFFLWMSADDFDQPSRGKYWQPSPVEIQVGEMLKVIVRKLEED